ncbi:NADH-quinone oxidoreductase subunit J [Actinomycetospora rhizophila]|uniref:NADH-quinone oxidoreductase subunit J n=1 Tax=Actinomycetospora rhizophila TaxID=1416876 RepID=A0ABV9ZL06_9PSEU
MTSGEAVVFWILGPVALAGGLGMIFSRNAVHSALWLVLTMLSLGVLYMVQQAPFLGVTQIIVYTGAIMILFVFVLMMVGRDASDSVVEVLRGQRLVAAVLGVGLAALAAVAVAGTLTAVQPVGLGPSYGPEARGNVALLGSSIFLEYVFPVILSAFLLTVSAVGALVYAFAGRPRQQGTSQRERVAERLRGPLSGYGSRSGPGVFATADSVATPALLPDGSVAPASLSRIIEATRRERLDADIADVQSDGGPAGEVDARALRGGDGEHHGVGSTHDRLSEGEHEGPETQGAR